MPREVEFTKQSSERKGGGSRVISEVSPTGDCLRDFINCQRGRKGVAYKLLDGGWQGRGFQEFPNNGLQSGFEFLGKIGLPFPLQ